MDKNKKKGFTLVELIVVLAILAILAAMLVPALTGYIDKANEKKVIVTARQYYVAAQTVASEAYANGDEITVISLHKKQGTNAREFTLEIGGTNSVTYLADNVYNSTFQDGNSKQLKYIRDFVKLAEESNDVKTFTIGAEKGSINEFQVLFANKMVMLVDGELVVHSWQL